MTQSAMMLFTLVFGARFSAFLLTAFSFRATTTSDNAGPTSAKTAVHSPLDPLASEFLASGGVAPKDK